ncbi:hypothetical protein PCANC_06583 [Puccinia coronata f. sp. avenae]|uniref:Uncharacterized protein n=1 Tax=Puccinia coronata f. sp. avenae TaxID=200324 RepID=A0A2N5VA28_9BASI|nr:hypothetical protein PCANC_06583 [Puccinia coronata f. sp. avenae]
MQTATVGLGGHPSLLRGAGQLIEHILGGVVIDTQRGVVMPVVPQGLHSPTNQSWHLADLVSGQSLMPLATHPRWSQEARVFQQILTSSKNPAKIQQAIFNLLSPHAKQAAKEHLGKRENLTSLPVKPAVCGTKLGPVTPSLHLRLQPMQPHRRPTMTGFCRSLNQKNYEEQSTSQSIPAALPEDTAMQDVLERLDLNADPLLYLALNMLT